MSKISVEEEQEFLSRCFTTAFKRNEILSQVDAVPNEIFFICKGLVRMCYPDFFLKYWFTLCALFRVLLK